MFYATADFSVKGFRLDTKLWFHEPTDIDGGTCIGAVVGLNPGSSTEDAHRRGFATVDRTMEAILKAYRSAAQELDVSLPKDSYVRLWNICYTTEKDSPKVIAQLLDEKGKEFLLNESKLDKTESDQVPGIWFAWTFDTPELVAQRALKWFNRKIPIFYLGADGMAHAFTGEKDFGNIRHPSRKSDEVLCGVARALLRSAIVDRK